MLPTIQIGPVSIQTPGLVLIICLWLGLSLAEKLASRRQFDANTLYNLVFVVLIVGVIGARLVYAARYSSAFIRNPISLISLNPGLLDVWGGFSFGFVAGLIYAQRADLAILPTLDTLTPVFALLAIGLGIAHLATGDAFGAPTTLPWSIELWGTNRHPSQIYEVLAGVIIGLIVWPEGRFMRGRPAGTVFLSYMSLSAGARLFLEAFRGDSEVIANNFRLPQLLAWLVLAAALWFLGKVRQQIEMTGSQ